MLIRLLALPCSLLMSFSDGGEWREISARCITLKILPDSTAFQGCHVRFFGTKLYSDSECRSLTGGHPAVDVADAEAAAELAKEEHELGRTPAREGREARRTWRRWKMQRKRKTMQHDLRHQTNGAFIPAFERASVMSLMTKLPSPLSSPLLKRRTLVILAAGRQLPSFASHT